MKKKTNGITSFLMLAIICTTVHCKKDSLQNNPVTASNTLNSISTTKNGPLGVVYVEVNSNNILNAGCYTLKNGGQQLFDIAIIFAGNINYDVSKKRAVLYNNDNVNTVLANQTKYIKPLQDKGIKVLLCILGNHGGAGISNFTSRAAAHDFAKQLSNAVTTFNLDGIDFDDEYADYGNNGTTQPNDSSFVLLLSELRSLMPSKIISFYFYGPATSRLTYNNQKAGDFLNYSWNAIYGTYIVPTVPGLAKSQLAPAAVWVNNTSKSTAKNLATRTVTDGYGAYLYYDLNGIGAQNYLSAISTALYNDSTALETDCLQSWPPPIDTSGVVFYENINYQGNHTSAIPKGNYSLAQLRQYGFTDNWASAAQLPYGWRLAMFTNNKFTGTHWVLKNDTPDFTLLNPNANDVISSVIIR